MVASIPTLNLDEAILMASHKFIYKEDVPRFIEVFKELTEGIYEINPHNKITIVPVPAPDTPMARAISWKDVEWFRLHMQRSIVMYSNGELEEDFDKFTYIAKVNTPAGGAITMMRNGSNIGYHHFAIIDCRAETIYFRRNIQASLRTIEVLGTVDMKLPLLLGEGLDDKDLRILEKRLKG